MLAAPLNVAILRALADGPRQQSDLRSATGSPPQTTLRAQLRRLGQLGAIARHRHDSFPGVVHYDLTAAGRDLADVADALNHWLEQSPGQALRAGSDAAKPSIKAMANAWSAGILRALAAGPLSLTELDGLIGRLSYPALERRLAAMRFANQIERQSSNGRGAPYALTTWLRQAVGPLAAAMRWERRHLALHSTPVARIDAEAIFMLALPLLELPVHLDGRCRLAIELPSEPPRAAGVVVAIERGAVFSCSTRMTGDVDTWIAGTPLAWLDAIVDADDGRLERGGDWTFGQTVLNSMHLTASLSGGVTTDP